MGACMKPPHLAIVTSLCKVIFTSMLLDACWLSLIIGWWSSDRCYRLLWALYQLNNHFHLGLINIFVSAWELQATMMSLIWLVSTKISKLIWENTASLLTRATLCTLTCTYGGTNSTWTRWQRHNDDWSMIRFNDENDEWNKSQWLSLFVIYRQFNSIWSESSNGQNYHLIKIIHLIKILRWSNSLIIKAIIWSNWFRWLSSHSRLRKAWVIFITRGSFTRWWLWLLWSRWSWQLWPQWSWRSWSWCT